MKQIPKHVAIIPDGNRRWAARRQLKVWQGHLQAGEYFRLKKLVDEARMVGVSYLSVWGFSTENWKRSSEEKKVLFNIIEKLIDEARRNLKADKIKFLHAGRKDRLPKSILDKIKTLELLSKEHKVFTVILCLDYGGRDEILRAVNKLLKEGKRNIDVGKFAKYLDTNGVPDPDLIIRTGGEKRLSGFMPFQSDYSELYFTDVYFPDFGVKELRKALKEFVRRKRRFGR